MKIIKKIKKVLLVDPEVLGALITVAILNIAYIFGSIFYLVYLWWNGGKILAFLFAPVLSAILGASIYESAQAIIKEQKDVERNKKRNSDT